MLQGDHISGIRHVGHIGNFVPLFVEGPSNVIVKGTFTYSGNTAPWAGSSQLQAGHSSIS